MLKLKPMSLPLATSITHQHLLSAIASEVRERKAVTITDAGCGGGALMRYLRTALPEVLPNCEINVNGFDVSDFAPHGNSNLKEGTLTVKIGAPWPYSDRSIDVLISNQVLEHVHDHGFFFKETARCLKTDGVAIYLAPVRECLYDGHVCQPLVHKIRNRDSAIRMIGIFRKLGFYSKLHADILPKKQGQDFPEFAADYLSKHCNYISMREMKRAARSVGLKLSFDYTPSFYTAKLRALAKREPQSCYSRHPLVDNMAAYLLRYISSVTMVLRHS